MLCSALWKAETANELYECSYNGCSYYAAYMKRKFDVYSAEKRAHKTRTYFEFALSF